VGGTGVFVLVGIGVDVLVGKRVNVNVGRGPAESRVRVGEGIKRVRVGIGVGVSVDISSCAGRLVSDGERVAVGINSETDCIVKAATVLMFETAESTRSCGCRAIGVLDMLGPAMAAADTMQNRLNPKPPAASTIRGARYSLSFKRDSPVAKTLLPGCRILP
jgi:hypothetical protein